MPLFEGKALAWWLDQGEQLVEAVQAMGMQSNGTSNGIHFLNKHHLAGGPMCITLQKYNKAGSFQTDRLVGSSRRITSSMAVNAVRNTFVVKSST